MERITTASPIYARPVAGQATISMNVRGLQMPLPVLPSGDFPKSTFPPPPLYIIETGDRHLFSPRFDPFTEIP
jgi:hypothetical protein